MEFILFIYLICFINLLFYVYDHVCHDDDFKIIGFFSSFWHFCADNNDTFGVLYSLTGS